MLPRATGSRIFDNIEEKLLPALEKTLETELYLNRRQPRIRVGRLRGDHRLTR
jgi:hypothetical protein